MLGRSMVKPFFPFETIEPNHHRYPHHPSRSPVVPTASTASNQNASLTTYTRRALAGIGCKTAALLALTSPWIHDLGRSVNQSIAAPVPSNDDFTVTPSGLRLLDLKVGRGGQVHPHAGAVVVVDWAGYTKGYQGKRIGNTTIPNGQDEPFRFRIGGGEVMVLLFLSA